ncbi:trk system potassium uptake protein TrkH [Tepidamorphus gemmatus]|uniref:Trk system potassium uptake protein TrkH n=1 Tax=Tepidamorphus gemmatus TaxID=747076 RepID=A0A4R3MEY3_9HYPH|nr:potassium transporter TrkG [Tepidamorphus gemmatus]TCT12379.1 trk system potassium uptake protein TrkH [Tepidamorphus gemmatus]
MIPVVYVFAYFLAAMSLSLIVPAIVAAGLGEGAQVVDFLISTVLCIFVAGAMMLSLSGRERRLRPAQRYLLALMLWTFLPLVGALPLFLGAVGLSPNDAYFEAVSALTTTGASVLPAPERLPRSIVLWLGMMQWIGGGLTLLVVVLALAPTGVGGLPETHARMIEHGGLPEKRRLVLVVRDVFPIYLSATALTFLALAATELDAFEALVLAFSSVSTGGITPRSVELGEYVSDAGLIVIMLAMLYGATNVLWHRDLLQLRRRRNLAYRESLWMIGACLVLGLIAGYRYFEASGRGVWLAMRDGLFTATSLITTTGFEVRYAGFEVFTLVVVATVVAIGAASFSTGGGIKVFRVGAMLLQGGRELNRLVYPHGVRPSTLAGQAYDMQLMKAIWSGFLAFVLAAVGLSLMVAAEGIPYDGAVVAALSALSNAGPVYASDWAGAGWPAYAELGSGTRLMLCAGMILGRLEIVAVLGLIVYAARRG